MSDPTPIAGTVNNGRRGNAVFPFYEGPVGIRDRGEWLDVAFFSFDMRYDLPASGTLDGSPVVVTAISARNLDQSAVKPNPNLPRAIIATVMPDAAS